MNIEPIFKKRFSIELKFGIDIIGLGIWISPKWQTLHVQVLFWTLYIGRWWELKEEKKESKIKVSRDGVVSMNLKGKNGKRIVKKLIATLKKNENINVK